ncbi:MAG: hypothetical protein M3076_19810 [Actinomycetota bacterium]|nr:hypothetical protein [Actinomycetota bacterium]
MTAVIAASLGALGVVVVLIAVWRRWPWLIGWGLAMCGASYGIWLVNGRGDGLGLATPLVAAGLLALGEITFYVSGRSHGSEYGARQVVWIAFTVLGALALCALVLIGATISVRGSLVLTIGGTLAAVLAIALPSVRFRRPTATESRSPSGHTRTERTERSTRSPK